MSGSPPPQPAQQRPSTSVAPRKPRPTLLASLTAPARCLPDFLIIGAQKCATTSLLAHLNEHPSVWSPSCKECHFLSGTWRPPSMYRAFFPLRAHRRRMERSAGPLQLGEATPYYMFHPAVPARAARLIPQARLIVLLRDPVERAYSHYRHCVRFGFETLSFEDALQAEADRLAGESERLERSAFATSPHHQHHSYVARGRYAEQIQRWLTHFDRSQLHVEFTEELIDDPAGTIERIERFLGLPERPPRTLERLNKGSAMGAMRDDTRARLRAEFAEPNRALEALLETALPWQSD